MEGYLPKLYVMGLRVPFLSFPALLECDYTVEIKSLKVFFYLRCGPQENTESYTHKTALLARARL